MSGLEFVKTHHCGVVGVSVAMFIPEATFILDIRVPGGYEG